MSRDRSLDEFLGGPSRDGDDAAGPADPDGVDDADGEPDPDPSDDAGNGTADAGDAGPDGDGDADAVAPAEPIRSWSPDGDACTACGATARVRWRHDGAYVCPDCKEW